MAISIEMFLFGDVPIWRVLVGTQIEFVTADFAEAERRRDALTADHFREE